MKLKQAFFLKWAKKCLSTLKCQINGGPRKQGGQKIPKFSKWREVKIDGGQALRNDFK